MISITNLWHQWLKENRSEWYETAITNERIRNGKSIESQSGHCKWYQTKDSLDKRYSKNVESNNQVIITDLKEVYISL